MVTVDDATYAKMKDTLYWGDAWAASKAKAQIESSYTDEQYNKFVNQLWGVNQQPTAPSSTPANTQTTTPQQTTPEMKQETEIKQQETAGSTAWEIQQQGELKPLSQEYYNQTSDDAQSKIINNLNNYRQTNPEYFRDYESFKKNFSYDARNDEQKQTLDSWYGGYQKWMELAWVPVTDLYTQYKDGQVSMNELENLRVYDPTKYAELQNQINKWNIIAAYDDDKWIDTTWMSIQDMAYNAAMQMFTQFMSGDSSSGASQYFRDYESKMESPEMLALSDQCTEVQEQMENIQSDLDSIKKSVEKEYEWTWATRSKINAIIADRSYDLQLQLRTLNSEYNKYATQYNNRMNQYQNEFQMQLQEYQLNQQARQQQMDELWFAMDLMNFETNDQRQQREWDYWVKQQEYTNWNINSKDYDTRYKAALKSVQNLLSQYEGIPMQRSAEQMAQDILKAIDWGSDLGAELTKINQQIQQKPEYKMLYNQTYRNPDAWFTESFTVWDTQYVKYNGQRYTADELNNRMWNWAIWNPKPYDAVSEEMFSIDPSKWGLGAFLMDSKNANGKKWWQCAKFVNDYLQQIWVGRYFWNEDIKTRQQWANSNTPKVWSIAIFDYGHTSSDWINHGHVAIVTQVNKDGSFVVKESNFPSWETIWTRTIQPWGTSLKWFFDPSKWAVSVSENVTTLSDVDEAKKQNYLEEARRGILNKSDLKPIWDLAAEQWWNDEWQEALKQWQNWDYSDTQYTRMKNFYDDFKTNPDVKRFDEAKTQFRQLEVALNDESWVWDMSAIFTFMKTLDPTSVVREWEFAAAQNTIWDANWDAILQKLENHINWEKLTNKQREQFKEVAREFIRIQADSYQQQYDFLKKRYERAWIEEIDLPPNNAQILLDSLWWSKTTISWLNVLKSSLGNLNKNILQSDSNTKATLQSKYWINN